MQIILKELKFTPTKDWIYVIDSTLPHPGSLQGQAGRAMEPPAPVEGVPPHGRVWNWMGFKLPPIPNHSTIP